MPSVATIITPDPHGALPTPLLRDVAEILKSDKAPVWLHPHCAADILFNASAVGGLDEARRILRQCLAAQPVDAVVQPMVNRRKKLLIADMDSTMIGQECIDELAAEIGLKDKVSAITERAMRGEIAFEPALRERVALLAGLERSIVEKVIESRITLSPGARILVQTMRANDAFCALVSGGFTAFTQIIADRLGFHRNWANVLTVADGRFTGSVQEPILGREAKRDRLLALSAEMAIPLGRTLAIGDGANDLAMVSEAGLGIAYRAKPALAAQADATIDHCDLTALLYAQGYSSADFMRG